MSQAAAPFLTKTKSLAKGKRPPSSQGQPTLGAKKSRPGFSVGDPQCDQLYKEFNDDPEIKKLLFPFDVKQTPETTTIVVNNEIAFTRSPDSPLLTVTDPHSNRSWRLPTHYNPHHHRFSPIMWPIHKSSSNLEHNIEKVSKQWRDRFDEMMSKKIPFPTSHQDIAKASSQAFRVNMVLQKKVRYIKNTFKKLQPIWWNVMVDRSTFKALVRVVGTSKDYLISWLDYAALAAHPQRQAIIDNIQALGPAAKLLRPRPYDDWAHMTWQQLLPAPWHQHWPSLLAAPANVQKHVMHDLNTLFEQDNPGTTTFQRSDQVISLDDPPTHALFSMNDMLETWSLFQDTIALKPCTPRQQEMIFLAARITIQINKSLHAPSALAFSTKDSARFLLDMSNIWIEMWPDLFAKGGHVINEWASVWRGIWTATAPNQQPTFPSSDKFDHQNIPWSKYQAAWSSLNLQRSLVPIEEAKPQNTSKRPKM